MTGVTSVTVRRRRGVRWRGEHHPRLGYRRVSHQVSQSFCGALALTVVAALLKQDFVRQ